MAAHKKDAFTDQYAGSLRNRLFQQNRPKAVLQERLNPHTVALTGLAQRFLIALLGALSLLCFVDQGSWSTGENVQAHRIVIREFKTVRNKENI
ncbi:MULTISPECIES: hypothetical protein [Pseudomonas syringae group]|uniref:hypothetical protein n=1 Tax=Pseudomonas syringae group TaxID=136849 RepID=UPI0011873F63|nr:MULTISPECIES: hypothetical protein [Pseudomonas syringae group]MDU8545943.1 hypothetical protein [Pseudomonas syringae group sp. J248-6]